MPGSGYEALSQAVSLHMPEVARMYPAQKSQSRLQPLKSVVLTVLFSMSCGAVGGFPADLFAEATVEVRKWFLLVTRNATLQIVQVWSWDQA